jgi:thiamine phosphate synthase YjbQ (UPF0047 family)
MGEYVVKNKTLTYNTKERLQFINITNNVRDFVKESKIDKGTITIQTHHTTCSVWINEDEKNLIGGDEIDHEGDLRRVLDRFANPKEKYGHNDIADSRNPGGMRNTHLCEPDEKGVCHECINGHAHAQGMILQSSINLIIENGKLVLGKWQEVLLIELDHDRERSVSFLVQGIEE